MNFHLFIWKIWFQIICRPNGNQINRPNEPNHRLLIITNSNSLIIRALCPLWTKTTSSNLIQSIKMEKVIDVCRLTIDQAFVTEQVLVRHEKVLQWVAVATVWTLFAVFVSKTWYSSFFFQKNQLLLSCSFSSRNYMWRFCVGTIRVLPQSIVSKGNARTKTVQFENSKTSSKCLSIKVGISSIAFGSSSARQLFSRSIFCDRPKYQQSNTSYLRKQRQSTL